MTLSEKAIAWAKEALFEYGPKIIAAILLLIIGLWVIKFLMRTLRKALAKREMDLSLQKFLVNLVNWVLKIMLFIAVLSQVGIESTSFVAVLGAAGLAVGLALQGSLSNFAGGVLIMLFRPFKVGDVIQAQGELGSVKEIDIFTTKLVTPQNRLVIIPNGSLSNGNITNFTAEGFQKIMLTIGVSYDADIKQTKEVLLNAIKKQEYVMEEPVPVVELVNLNDSSIDFTVRCAVPNDHFWPTQFALLPTIKEDLDAAGIEIPYPHQVEIQKQP
ncbi:MAG: mechanosensitive ion channel [Flavobacteriaceae bacterium]